MLRYYKYLFVIFYIHYTVYGQNPIPYNLNADNNDPNSPIFGTSPWADPQDYIYSGNNITVGNLNCLMAARVQFRAAKSVHLSTGTHAGNLYAVDPNWPTPYFHAGIDSYLIEIASFHQNGFSNIPKYSRFEIGLKLPAMLQQQIDNFISGSQGTNPYNPDEIKVECSYKHQQTGNVYKRYGYYYRDYVVQNNIWVEQPTDYKFRLNFAPPLSGKYIADIKVYLSNGNSVYYGQFSLDVAESGNKGHLGLSGPNFRKMEFSDGTKFFGIGQNVGYVVAPWPSPYNVVQDYPPNLTPSDYDTYYRNYISDLANNNGNFVRLRLDPELGFPIEWRDKHIFASETQAIKPLSQCLTNYDHNQRQMYEFDKVIKLCENSNIFIMLNILQDQNWNTNNIYGDIDPWDNKNPYSTLAGQGSNGIAAFFTNSQVVASYKKLLFYIHARWGYSTNIAMWEMINETDNLDNNPATGYSPYRNTQPFRYNVDAWINDMQSYLQNLYPFHPMTTGYGSDVDAFNSQYEEPSNLDIRSTNSYGNSVNNNQYENIDFNKRSPKSNSYADNSKPFIFGELGSTLGDCPAGNGTGYYIDNSDDRPFHNAVWATTMMGGIASGMFWNDFHQEKGVNHRNNFNALKRFVDKVNWNIPMKPGAIESLGGLTCKVNGERRGIFTFYQKNDDASYIIGWAMDKSSYWMNDQYGFLNSTAFQQSKLCEQYSQNPNPYDNASENCHPSIIIDNVDDGYYNIKIYNTYSPDDTPFEDYIKASSDGVLSFQRKMNFNIADPWYPDYAFIITKVSNRASNAETNDNKNSSHKKEEEYYIDNQMYVFPNPGKGVYSLKTSALDEYYISIYNVIGCLAKSISFSGTEQQIDIQNLSNGIYNFVIRSKNGSVKTIKVIKE
jgi:hypothetical protein